MEISNEFRESMNRLLADKEMIEMVEAEIKRRKGELGIETQVDLDIDKIRVLLNEAKEAANRSDIHRKNIDNILKRWEQAIGKKQNDC